MDRHTSRSVNLRSSPPIPQAPRKAAIEFLPAFFVPWFSPNMGKEGMTSADSDVFRRSKGRKNIAQKIGAHVSVSA